MDSSLIGMRYVYLRTVTCLTLKYFLNVVRFLKYLKTHFLIVRGEMVGRLYPFIKLTLVFLVVC